MNHHLTKREREAWAMFQRGRSLKWIAYDMGVSRERVCQLLGSARRRIAHARAFSREKEFRSLYEREAALRNLRLIANAFYHLANLLP